MSDKTKDTLIDFLGDIRIFFYGGIRSLPLTIGGTMLIMSLFTANYAMLFFLVGYLLLVPFAVWLGNFASNMAVTDPKNSMIRFPLSDVCTLTTPYLASKNNVSKPDGVEANIFSPWLAMVSFFIGYLLTNALKLYNIQPIANAINITKDTPAAKEDVEAGSSRRRSQAVISLICIFIFTIYVLYSRLQPGGGCETWVTAAMTLLVFGWLGNGWYAALSSIGQDRLSDLFGIANRLLTPGAVSNQPIACVQMTA